MKTPHKHAEVIKAWADGYEVQYKHKMSGIWTDSHAPVWAHNFEYRVKPEPKPLVEIYANARIAYPLDEMRKAVLTNCGAFRSKEDNIKLMFDGDTHKLRYVELLQPVEA